MGSYCAFVIKKCSHIFSDSKARCLLLSRTVTVINRKEICSLVILRQVTGHEHSHTLRITGVKIGATFLQYL
jgi:hypothetical protein